MFYRNHLLLALALTSAAAHANHDCVGQLVGTWSVNSHGYRGTLVLRRAASDPSAFTATETIPTATGPRVHQIRGHCRFNLHTADPNGILEVDFHKDLPQGHQDFEGSRLGTTNEMAGIFRYHHIPGNRYAWRAVKTQ